MYASILVKPINFIVKYIKPEDLTILLEANS